LVFFYKGNRMFPCVLFHKFQAIGATEGRPGLIHPLI